ncbi:MAG: CBS domain-containing protein [Candidatus Pacearchaeota archaeon]
MKVSEVMSQAMVIDYALDLRGAAKMMSKNKRETLIIVSGNKIMGILTERDILSHISSLNLEVGEVMTKKIVSISPEKTLEQAMELMIKNNIKNLPVIENKKLVGLIKLSDIVGQIEKEDNGDFIIE